MNDYPYPVIYRTEVWSAERPHVWCDVQSCVTAAQCSCPDIQPDILNPPLLRLTSRKPLWLDLQPTDIKSRWWYNWKSAQVVNSHLVRDPTNRPPGFDLPRIVVSAEPFSHRTGTLRCLQKEMATYRHWSVSLWRDPNDVPHCRILSSDKTEWRLISATLCGWRCWFVADQLWFMTRIREEEVLLCMRGELESKSRQQLDRCLAATVWAARHHSNMHHLLSPLAAWNLHQCTRAWRYRLKSKRCRNMYIRVKDVNNLKQYLVETWSATSSFTDNWMINGEVVLTCLKI